MSARVEVPIQCLIILFPNDVSGYLTHFEPGSPVTDCAVDCAVT